MIHSFMQLFTEHLLCARRCSSSMDTAMNKTEKTLPSRSPHSSGHTGNIFIVPIQIDISI